MSEKTLPEAISALAEGKSLLSLLLRQIKLHQNILRTSYFWCPGDKKQDELKRCVIAVEEAATASGLLPEHIISLTEFIASRKTSKQWVQLENICAHKMRFLADSAILSRAVRSLIPRASVPCSAILRLLGSLKGQILSLQLLIIRWIILIYDIIDNKSNLHAIYGVLFYYLQNDELVSTEVLEMCTQFDWSFP